VADDPGRCRSGVECAMDVPWQTILKRASSWTRLASCSQPRLACRSATQLPAARHRVGGQLDLRRSHPSGLLPQRHAPRRRSQKVAADVLGNSTIRIRPTCRHAPAHVVAASQGGGKLPHAWPRGNMRGPEVQERTTARLLEQRPTLNPLPGFGGFAQTQEAHLLALVAHDRC